MALFDDFCQFSKLQLQTGDIDPMYPVLKEVYKQDGIDRETALWRTLLYVCWYHIGTAETVWTRFPTPRELDKPLHYYPSGVERRGFRGNDKGQQLVNSVYRMAKAHGGLLGWVTGVLRGASMAERPGEAAWTMVRASFMKFVGNGPWAGYKWADLLKNVHGYRIDAPDIGVGGASETAGPIPGMVAITGLPWEECATSIPKQRGLLDHARAVGVPFAGLDQLETCLCDYNSLLKGTFYPGRDIDMMMTQLEHCSPVFWRARSAVFDERCLGEVQGWNGVRKSRDKAYSRSGVILAPWDPG